MHTSLHQVFTLEPSHRITVVEPNSEKLKGKSGKVSGSILSGGKARKLSGLLQLEANIGADFFFSDMESLPFAGEN